MAELESSLPSEQGESPQCDGDVKNHHEVCVPIIAECMSDRALVGLKCVNPGECGLEDGTYASGNLIHIYSGGKIFEKSDAKSAVLGLKSGCPKELMDSRIQVDPKGVVPMDLIEKMDQGIDVESGREISIGNGCDNSFWGSAKRLFGKALDSFISGDFGQGFNGSTKIVDSTFGLCKSAEDPRKSGIACLLQKSECNNGENPRNTEVLKSGKLRNGNVNNIKASSKKPPRPPRPPKPAKTTVDPSKERLVKAILRRAKLERMITLKKKQIARSKSSNSSVWALAFTLCFCVIMILQGLFSQGNGSAQISPEAAVQTSVYSVLKDDDHAITGEAWNPIEPDQLSASLHHFRGGFEGNVEVGDLKPNFESNVEVGGLNTKFEGFEGKFEIGVSNSDIQDKNNLQDLRGGPLVVMECGPACCCDQSCRNRVSQQGLSARVEIVRHLKKGWCLHVVEPVKQGAFVCEYAGEFLTNTEARERQKHYDEANLDKHKYFCALLVIREHLPSGQACLRLNIDATIIGNVARFINHSCDGGNLLLTLVRSSGSILPRPCLFASRDISAGEELTFSYGIAGKNSKALPCFCMSPACFGVLPSEST